MEEPGEYKLSSEPVVNPPNKPHKWTTEMVIAMGVDDVGLAYEIAYAHNAALDAKDELHAAALQVLERHHQKQLAAERERAEQINAELVLRGQQLAVEREKVKP
jgi:hypothetical protein